MTEWLAALWANPSGRGLLLGAVVAGGALGLAGLSTWWERKFVARMQNRFGPTVVGPKGLLQVAADGFKLLLKEDIVPDAADRPLFQLAPPLAVFLALAGLAVVPLASGLVVADLNVGVLFLLAMGSLMVLPVWMAGWGSANKYALLGGMRAVAQGVAYEIPLVLSALVPVILAGSMNLSDIIWAQQGYRWFALWPPGPGLVAFVIFLMASLAEANRIPFDIPEAESELVAGITTEYTGMKFGMFYLGEYIHTIVASAILAALFLGGWEGPWAAGRPWVGFGWMLCKTCVLFTGILWIRWTFLRLRSDQLMSLCWKWLIPISLATMMAAAVWVHLFPGGGS